MSHSGPKNGPYSDAKWKACVIIDRVTFFNSLAMKPLFSHLPAFHLSDGERETLPALNNARVCSSECAGCECAGCECAAAELISERGNHKKKITDYTYWPCHM